MLSPTLTVLFDPREDVVIKNPEFPLLVAKNKLLTGPQAPLAAENLTTELEALKTPLEKDTEKPVPELTGCLVYPF